MKLLPIQTNFVYKKNTNSVFGTKTDNAENNFSNKIDTQDFLNYKNYTIPFMKGVVSKLSDEEADKVRNELKKETFTFEYNTENRFEDEGIDKIIGYMSEKPNGRDCFEVLDLLVNARYKEFIGDGYHFPKFYGYEEILTAFDHINSDNKDLVGALLDTDKRDMEPEALCLILDSVNKDNKDSLAVLLEAEDENGNPRFDEYDICNILSRINSRNSAYLPRILGAEDFKDAKEAGDTGRRIKPRFSAESIQTMLDAIIKMKDDEKQRFDNDIDILYTAFYVDNDDKLDALNRLIDSERNFKKGQIDDILQNTTPDNKICLDILLDCENIQISENWEFAYTLQKIKQPEDVEYFFELVNEKDENGSLVNRRLREIGRLIKERK